MFNKKDNAVNHSNLSPWVLVAIIVLFTALFFRNSGLYPLVIDEYYYNQFSRLTSFSAAYYPNYLYYAIYRSTLLCGDNFLSCVQFLNCGLYVAAFFPIYRIAQTVCAPKIAIWVSLLALLAPFNYFTAFFMLEAPFFCVFFVFIWWLLNRDRWAFDRYWIFSGFFLGLISLVKINGLFLLPAILMYLIYSYIQRQKSSPANDVQKSFSKTSGLAVSITGFIFGLLLAKLGIAWLLAGPAGLTVGGMYTGDLSRVAQQVFTPPQVSKSGIGLAHSGILSLLLQWWTWVLEAAQFAWLNLVPMCFIFAPAIGTLFFLLKTPAITTTDEGFNLRQLSLLTLLLFTNLIVLAIGFTWIAVHFGGEQPYAHRRYYEFAYPLLLLCIAGAVSQGRSLGSVFWRGLLGTFFAGLILYSLLAQKGIYWYADWFSSKPTILYGWALLTLVTLFIWVFNNPLGNRIFLWVLFPLVVIFSNVGIADNLAMKRMQPSNALQASLFVRQYLDAEAQSRLIIAGHDVDPLSTFYLKNASVPIIPIPPGTFFNQKMFIPQKDWVLLMGNTPIDPDLLQKTHQDFLPLGYATLFGGHGMWQLDFKKSSWPKLIEKSAGLFFPPEPWGNWTLGDKMELQFSAALPRKFELSLKARAFGPNVGQAFYIELGQSRIPFILKGEFQTVTLEVDNPFKLSNLNIYIPQATAPKSLGLGEDDRLLGMAIEEITIKW